MPCCPHIEISQLVCCANQLTGFYMRATLVFNGLTTYMLFFLRKNGTHFQMALEFLEVLSQRNFLLKICLCVNSYSLFGVNIRTDATFISCKPSSICCPLKGHTYLCKPAAEVGESQHRWSTDESNHEI